MGLTYPIDIDAWAAWQKRQNTLRWAKTEARQLVGKLVEDTLGQSTRRIVDVGAHFVSVHFQRCLNCLPVPVECGREQ